MILGVVIASYPVAVATGWSPLYVTNYLSSGRGPIGGWLLGPVFAEAIVWFVGPLLWLTLVVVALAFAGWEKRPPEDG